LDDCIFCKIVEGKIDSAKIWEDGEFVSILDINPNTRGMTLVLPKRHSDLDIFEMGDEEYAKLMEASKKTVSVLKKGLGVNKVAMVMEGMGVNHAHIKLYPLHGVGKEFKETWADGKIFFEKYEGYISTLLGPKADISELKKLADGIKRRNG